MKEDNKPLLLQEVQHRGCLPNSLPETDVAAARGVQQHASLTARHKHKPLADHCQLACVVVAVCVAASEGTTHAGSVT